MTEIQHYQVALEPTDEGGARIRVMPYGVTIEHQGDRITYDPGALTVPDFVPINLDHGDGALDRIGLLDRHQATAEALYGNLSISDTAIGRDVRTLLRDGVLTDVSAGVRIDASSTDRQGVVHLTGTLDHIAIVTRGAFSGGPNGARVLAAYQEGTPPVPESETPPIEQYATRDDIDAMQRVLEGQIAALAVPSPAAPVSRPGNFRDLREYFTIQRNALNGDAPARERMALYTREAEAVMQATRAGLSEYALADDTTTTAAGLVPDYLSSEVISLIDNFRPFVESIPSDPVGPYGMSVVYPKVVTKPDVGVQAAEKTEVESQAMDIDPFSVDLVTFAGASDVSLQLIERSQPSFLNLLFAELAGVYAGRTDAASIAAVVAAVDAMGGHEATVADLGASAAATWAAFAAAAAAIAADSKRPADTVWIAADRFGQLLELVDSDGRPLIVPDESGPSNAQGVGSFGTFRFRYGGLRVIVDPHAAAGTVLIGWARGASTVELRPQQLRALQVDLLGVNAGVWGLFATVVKYPQAFYIIKAA